MITVELTSVTVGEPEPERLGQLFLDDDLSIGNEGLPSSFDLEGLRSTPIAVSPDGRRITFEQDPIAWFRHLPQLLSNPYLNAEILEDTFTPAPDTPAAASAPRQTEPERSFTEVLQEAAAAGRLNFSLTPELLSQTENS